jgi:hypothetical protein
LKVLGLIRPRPGTDLQVHPAVLQPLRITSLLQRMTKVALLWTGAAVRTAQHT